MFASQGGFARCYELTDMETNKVYAGKIVAKSLLTKSHQKEKVEYQTQSRVCACMLYTVHIIYNP